MEMPRQECSYDDCPHRAPHRVGALRLCRAHHAEHLREALGDVQAVRAGVAATLAHIRARHGVLQSGARLPDHVEPVAPVQLRPVEPIRLAPLPERPAKAPKPVQVAPDMPIAARERIEPLGLRETEARRRAEILRLLGTGWMARGAIEDATGWGRYASFVALQRAEAAGLVRKAASGRRTEWGLSTAPLPSWAAALVPMPERIAALRAWMPRRRWWSRTEAQAAIGCSEEEIRHAVRVLQRGGEIVVHGRAHLSLWGVPGLRAPEAPLVLRVVETLRLKSPMRLEELAQRLSTDRKKIQKASECAFGDERIAKGVRGWSYRAKEGE